MSEATSTVSESDPPISLKLRLMATTDVHGALMPFDYVRDVPDPNHGLAKVGRLIAQARQEVPGHLLFDCGDMIEGTALADIAARLDGTAQAGDGPHPVIAAMNALGYDAAALGNHDFNYGLSYLRRVLRAAAFPVLSANFVAQGGAVTPFRGASLLAARAQDAQGSWHLVRVGVFGVLPPQTVDWDAHHLRSDYRVLPIVDTARHRAKALRAAGADVVVGLVHSGIPARPEAIETGPRAENAALDVAALSDVDAVFCGHTHGLLPGPTYAGLEDHVAGFDAAQGLVGSTPIAMAGSAARALALIDLDMRRTDSRWHPIAARTHLRTVSDATQPNDTVLKTCTAPHLKTRQVLSDTVGRTNAPLHTFFAAAGGSRALDFLAHVQTTAAERTLAEAGLTAQLPLLSAVAPFRVPNTGGIENVSHIRPGPILRRHLYDLYPYPNGFAVVELTGRDLRRGILISAKIFAQLTPGLSQQLLLRTHMPTYGFDVVYGAQTTFDLGFGPNDLQRVARVEVDGHEVDDYDRFFMATNTYRAGILTAAGLARRVLPLPAPRSRDLVENALAAGLVWPQGPAQRPWRFAPMEATTAQFRTSPAAQIYRDEATADGIALGETDNQGYLVGSVSF